MPVAVGTGHLLVALLLVAYVAAQGASSSLPTEPSPWSALSSPPALPPSPPPSPSSVPLLTSPQPPSASSSRAPPNKKLLEYLLGNLPTEVRIPSWWRSNSTTMDDLPPDSAYDPSIIPPTRPPKPTRPATGSSVTSMAGGDGILAIINNLENTTASRMCSRLLLDYQRYERLLCSDEVVESLINRGSSSLSYYDLSRCSPTNYDLGCLSGFFSPDPPEEGEQRRFLNAFYPVVQCCPGHYCPEGLVCMIPCSAGAYCPPVRTANNGTSCEPYETVAKPYLGCGGAETNFACPAGYYCPNTSTTILCPEDSYCPSGSRRPQRCPPLASCPPGASAPDLDLGGLAEVLAVLALLFGIILLSRRRSDRTWEKAQTARRTAAASKGTQGNDKDDEGEIEEQSLLLPSTDARCRVDIQCDNLGVQLADGRWLLRGVNGRLSAGHVTAIMGPSGAGKSVLLHTLAGRTSGNTITGGIVINGFHDQSLLGQCRQLVGFVPQEDIMHRSLTVFENVDFNAQWRLPRSMHRRQKMDAVFGVLEVLGLDNPRVMRTRIGDDTERGVSGGERKRVNIGMELVAQPSLLLLDEPTSGLDASTSIDVVRALKTVASSGGVNVVVVLHQPRAEILRLFDDLLLLAPGGRTVYAGPTGKALIYFNSLGYTLPDQCNPADFFLDIISGSVPRLGLVGETIDKEVHLNHLVEQWENYRSAEMAEEDKFALPHDDIPAVMHRRKTANILKQTWLCTKRAVIQRTRELNTALTDYCLVAIAGLVLGLLFHAVELNKVPNVNLFISMALGFAATQQSLRLFGSERTVFEREAFTGIDRTAYFLGKNLSSLADLFILPFVFLSMFYSFSNPRGSFGEYLLLLVAAQFALSGLGHLISVLLDPAKAQLAAVVVTLMLSGISGFSPLKSDLGSFGVVCFGSYGFWLMEALFIIEADHYPDIFAQTKNDIAAMFDYDLVNRSLGMHVGILVGMGLASRVLCLLMLLVMHRGTPLGYWSSLKHKWACWRR